MGSSNFEKFQAELRLVGIELGKDELIQKDDEVFGVDLRALKPELFEKFPFYSEYLQELERLKLPKVRMKQYPPIFHLENLTHLNMNSIYGGNLPEQFYNMKQLQSVNLAANSITTLSPSISELKNLRCLALGTNSLEDLPDVFDKLGNLEYLYLYNNQLRDLPDSLGELENLKVLVIEKNNLTTLSPSIMKLTQLKALKIDKNSLQLTPANYIWLDILTENGCQFHTTGVEICYHFSVDYRDKNVA